MEVLCKFGAIERRGPSHRRDRGDRRGPGAQGGGFLKCHNSAMYFVGADPRVRPKSGQTRGFAPTDMGHSVDLTCQAVACWQRHRSIVTTSAVHSVPLSLHPLRPQR